MTPNPVVLIIAFMWAVASNQYFGWNWLPASDAELMSDGLFCLLFALAYIGRDK